jgi:hypothetical protein
MHVVWSEVNLLPNEMTVTDLFILIRYKEGYSNKNYVCRDVVHEGLKIRKNCLKENVKKNFKSHKQKAEIFVNLNKRGTITRLGGQNIVQKIKI